MPLQGCPKGSRDVMKRWILPPTLQWKEGRFYILDQTLLPEEVVYRECKTPEEVAESIKTMRVRGAPAIGVAGAFGVFLAIKDWTGSKERLWEKIEEASNLLRNTRPTAYNLFYAIDRMLEVARKNMDKEIEEIKMILLEEALTLYREDIEANRRIGEHGSQFIRDGAKILTICNAGSLATVWYGTALGVIRRAVEDGKRLSVYACETRPRLQGVLTAFELLTDGIPITLICDFMAGYLMRKGEIDIVITGADRIALNGDVANKIGTYTLAVLASAHNIPFIVAAPTSTIDPSIRDGKEIPIEERAKEEVLYVKGKRLLPQEVDVINPAFDLTPARYITAIVTERGVAHPPFEESLPKLLEGGE